LAVPSYKRKKNANYVSLRKTSTSQTVCSGNEVADSIRIIEEKNMAEENKINSGTAETPSKLESSKIHARRAAEDLKSAAGAVAEEYRGKAEQAWEDATLRARTFQEDAEEYVRGNPTKAVFTALGIGFVLGLIFRR
jgi:ElaB/YqjD/DUF883 family membrane-anchored ribosome-binding protein